MTKKEAPTCSRSYQAGISLLELLIGIIVSMLTVLVITQVFLTHERQRQIPISSSDAQINGILALDALQRNIRQSGYGLGNGPWVGLCTAKSNTVNIDDIELAPVIITTGGSENPSDMIEILSSGKLDPVLPVKVVENRSADPIENTGVGAGAGAGAGANVGPFLVPSHLGFEEEDWVIASNSSGNDCDLFKIDSLSSTAPWKIFPSAPIDQAYAAGSLLLNMGQPLKNKWSVNESFFLIEESNFPTPSVTKNESYSGIVLLRAFYAKDINSDGTVDTYDTTKPSDRKKWSEVLGIRLAIVVRNQDWNKEEITKQAPEWNLGKATVANSSECTEDTSSQCISLKVDHTSADWKHYRYQVYETLIPLRNMLWKIG